MATARHTAGSRSRRSGTARPRPRAGTRGRRGAACPLRPLRPPAKADDAINLGSTVLPILVKTYWKQGLAVLVVIVAIVVLIAL